MIWLILIWGIIILFLSICIIPAHKINVLKAVSLVGTFGIFIYSLLLWVFFNPLTTKFQYMYSLTWYSEYALIFGIDHLNLIFILLSTLLIPSCLFCVFTSIGKKLKEVILIFILIEFLLILLFSTLDLGLFYICFESILIPMFLLIGFWGSNKRKVIASYLFFLFTMLGSIIMLVGLLYLIGKLNTLNYFVLISSSYSIREQLWLWPSLFLACAIKVPMFPVHGWLPEAHVEAPTAGSVILAGVLLKIGVYALVRFVLPLFPYATVYYSPLINAFALIGSVYAALMALRQLDLKKIIAYSSIAHMNFGIFGLFTLNSAAIQGSLLLMLSHGFVSSALFILVGVVYDRYKIRLINSLTGLTQFMPLFSIFFFFFFIGQFGFSRYIKFY